MKLKTTKLLTLASVLITSLFLSCSHKREKASKRNLASLTHNWPSPDFTWWEEERTRRERQLNKYLKKNKKEYRYYKDWPLGTTGIPVIMFRLFPTLFPDVWGEEGMREMGLLPRVNEDRPIVPQGMGFGPSFKELTKIPILKQKLRVQVVNLTCAGCHTAWVRGPEGNIQTLVGAPNNIFDAHRFRHNLAKVAAREDFTKENFIKALQERESKSKNWAYRKKRYYGQYLIDKKALNTVAPDGRTLVGAVKESIVSIEKRRRFYLDRFYNQGEIKSEEELHQKLLNTDPNNVVTGGLPGQLDAFSTAAFLLMPEKDYFDIPKKELDEKFKTYFGIGPAIIDIMSAWRQDFRTYAQWDGNIPHKLMRNLSSAAAVIREPSKVNYKVVDKSTKFVSDLPPPPYLWQVDKNKYKEGKKIFKSACIGCHYSGATFLPVKLVGTDPNRAYGLTEKTRTDSIQVLRDSCKDSKGNYKHEACKAPSDEIIVPRSDNPGYIGPPLDGLWARAPYLHNGSIPTLYHLLVPSERPKRFLKGTLDYDTIKVGFEWEVLKEKNQKQKDSTVRVFRVSALEEKSGFSNRGHEDKDIFFGGIDFQKEVSKREALIEYLKTL